MDNESQRIFDKVGVFAEAECTALKPEEVRLIAQGMSEGLLQFASSSRLHAKDSKGDTPLHLAARLGNLIVCDLFIRFGADPRARNNAQQTPTDLAFAEGNDLVGSLLASLENSDDTIKYPEGDANISSPGNNQHSPEFYGMPLDSTSPQESNILISNEEWDVEFTFQPEIEPEAYFAQHHGQRARGDFVFSSHTEIATTKVDQQAWTIDISGATVTGDAIGSYTDSTSESFSDGEFLLVNSAGRKSLKKAVVQTGTRIGIDRAICKEWVESIVEKKWCSDDDVEILISEVEGNGELEDLRINVYRELEAAGFSIQDQPILDKPLLDDAFTVTADELADALHATLARYTRLPGNHRFNLKKSAESRLLRELEDARQALQLEVLENTIAIEKIVSTAWRVMEGGIAPALFTLKDLVRYPPYNHDTADFIAAVCTLENWIATGSIMHGKQRRQALNALGLLDVSDAFYSGLVRSLAILGQGSDELAKLNQLVSDNSAATERLVLEHLPYARRFASRNVEGDEDPEDLFQIAFIGLWSAIRRFDPERGHRFLVYATYWMRQAIVRSRAEVAAAIRIPIHRGERLRKFSLAMDRLDINVSGFVSDIDIAALLECPIDEVRQLRNIPRVAHYPNDDQEWDTLLTAQIEVSTLEKVEMESVLANAISELPERQAEIVRMRFGIGRETDMTLEEIGQRFGVTRERIRQIEAKALNFMSHPARRRRLRALLGYEDDRKSNFVVLKAHKDSIPSEEMDLVEGAIDDEVKAIKEGDHVDQIMQLWSGGMDANDISQELGNISWPSVIGNRNLDGS